MIRYSAEVIEEIDNGPGVWNCAKIGVFRSEGDNRELIGEYKRNYPNFYRTFFHFRRGEKDYALFSPSYTATRIMELPSCKDIGGEEPAGFGFCPVDFEVPCYIEREYIDLQDKPIRHRVNSPAPEDLISRTSVFTPLDEKTGKRIRVEKPSYPVSPLLYYPFGFVAGCIWGDDSSWKIQYLDLSEVERGILKRDERFGYIALPDDMTLHQAIGMQGYKEGSQDDWKRSISIVVQKQFFLDTGQERSEKDW